MYPGPKILIQPTIDAVFNHLSNQPVISKSKLIHYRLPSDCDLEKACTESATIQEGTDSNERKETDGNSGICKTINCDLHERPCTRCCVSMATQWG